MTVWWVFVVSGCSEGDTAKVADETGETSDTTDTGPGTDTDTDDRTIHAEEFPLATKVYGVVPQGTCCPSTGDIHIAVGGGADFDGDGRDEVLIGLPSAAAYVVAAPERGGVRIQEAAFCELTGSAFQGYAMSPAGDTNGDGVEELLVGAPLWTTGLYDYGLEGSAYLLSGPIVGDLDLESSSNARIRGEDASMSSAYSQVTHWTGWSLAGLGDTNGDGFDDILIGASEKAYLLLGPVDGEVEIATAADVRWKEVQSHFGDIVVAPGDLNGDGLADVLIADPIAMWFGPVVSAGTRDDADAEIVGGCDSYAVSAAGDVNGDGHDDLVVGWGGDDDVAEQAGAAYVSLGPYSDDRDLCGDHKLLGESELDTAGAAVAGAGDIDADGFADVIIGAQRFDGTDPHSYDAPGAAYVLFGPVTATSLAEADVIIRGEGVDQLGYAVAGVGDVDGDGLADIAIGGPGDDEGAYEAGAAWIFYGSELASYHR